MKFIKKYINLVFDLLIPNTCLNCEKPLNKNMVICKQCTNRLAYNSMPICFSCGRSLKSFGKTGKCQYCQKADYSFDRNYSLFQYKDPLINIIYNFKYKHILKAKSFLFEHLSEFLEFYDIIDKHNIGIITSVPLHPSKFRERGYNQSKIIAQLISENNSTNYKNLLIAKRYKRSQTRIKHKNRKDKVKGIFECTSSVSGSVLLIDDVFTTGATLSECASLLKANGASQVISLTLCSTLK